LYHFDASTLTLSAAFVNTVTFNKVASSPKPNSIQIGRLYDYLITNIMLLHKLIKSMTATMSNVSRVTTIYDPDLGSLQENISRQTGSHVSLSSSRLSLSSDITITQHHTA